MAITVVGQGSAAATSVAIPAHQVGDLILVFARGTAAAPVKPTAGGTVPNWVAVQSAIANSIGLTSVGFIATATNTTTGVFASATHICVLVLRAGAGNVLEIGFSSSGNGNNTQTIIYPALTLTRLNGTSMGVRCGTRVTADSEVGTSLPSGYTNQTIQPAGASALMAVHTRAALVANPTADTVTTAGTNAAYRAHTVEVEEVLGPQAYTVPINDSLALADAPGKTRGIGRALADVALQLDALLYARGYGRTLGDGVSLADASARVRGSARTLADASALADALARTAAFVRTPADLAVLADLVTVARLKTLAQADLVALADALSRSLGRGRTLADTVLLADATARSVSGPSAPWPRQISLAL